MYGDELFACVKIKFLTKTRNVNRSPTGTRTQKQTRAHLTPKAETIAIDVPRPLFQTSILWSTHV